MTVFLVCTVATYRNGRALSQFCEKLNGLTTVRVVQHFAAVPFGEFAPHTRIGHITRMNPPQQISAGREQWQPDIVIIPSRIIFLADPARRKAHHANSQTFTNLARGSQLIGSNLSRIISLSFATPPQREDVVCLTVKVITLIALFCSVCKQSFNDSHFYRDTSSFENVQASLKPVRGDASRLEVRTFLRKVAKSLRVVVPQIKKEPVHSRGVCNRDRACDPDCFFSRIPNRVP